jgi:methane monooxygenase component A gamma chain
MPKQNWYQSPLRDEWFDRISALATLGEGIAALQAFRAENTGPDRSSYDLKTESNWIESRMEMRVAQLHSEQTASDADLLEKTIDGRPAGEVAAEWLAKAEGVDDAFAMSALCVAFRKACKPPMMPINYFMPTERELVTKLLKLRAPSYLSTPIEELRARRGVTVLSLQ